MISLENLKKHVSIYLAFCAATALVGTILGVILIGKSPYIASPWLLATLLALVTSAIGVFRVRGIKTPYRFGVVAIQHVWWLTSIGLAGVLFYPADYFMKVAGSESVAMAVISAIWLFWGLYLIYTVHKETKVPIAP